ncbi:uncharacterized protein LOC124493355 [Dermatophagoides farinae]|uniref:uncharacterized protein LOC124493355 n=1 Tax=Dermatophagoides farinae TaxID=6954 RepID=UPI003F612563
MMTKLDNQLQIIYQIFSIIYLNSYSLSSYRTVFEYQTSFLLLNNQYGFYHLFILLPLLEKLQFILSTLLGIFYITKSFNYIQYSDTFRFLIGDLTTIIIPDGQQMTEKIISLFIANICLVSEIVIYNTFYTQNSLAFRTLIIYMQEFNDDFDKMYRIMIEKCGNYSRSSCLLFNYSLRKFSTNFKQFRLFMNRWISIGQIFHALLNLCFFIFIFDKLININRPLWQLIISILMIQLLPISMNFTAIFAYSPFFIGSYTMMLGMKTVRQIRMDIRKILTLYEWITNKRKKLNINDRMNIRLIEYNINRLLKLYTRLIIFSEEIQLYMSRLILWILIIGTVGTQLVLYLLKQIQNDQIFLIFFLYYTLVCYFNFIIALTYFISKFNSKLNAIRFDLQRMIIVIDKQSCRRFKFLIMNYYERMVNIKPWGIKIGTITVLTKGIFCKLMLFYARFTMLSSKLSG